MIYRMEDHQTGHLISKPLPTPISIPLLIPPSIINPQKHTAGRHKQQQRRIGPVPGRVSLLRLIALVNPHPDYLARSPE